MDVQFKYNIGDTAWGVNNKKLDETKIRIKQCLYGTPLFEPNYLGVYYDAVNDAEADAETQYIHIWHHEYTEECLFDSEDEAKAYIEYLKNKPEEESGATEDAEVESTETENIETVEEPVESSDTEETNEESGDTIEHVERS